MLTIVLVLLAVLLLLAMAPMMAGTIAYRKTFQGRFEGGGDYYPYFSRMHPGWQRQSITFSSDRGDPLRGYVFSYAGPQKAMIVLCHGYGMSLNDYLPESEYFCRCGYSVLAFDGSGTGDSGGILYGLPQHIRDLAACLNYVNSTATLSHLPLLLYGHSWGGYAVDCVSLLGSWPIQGIISASAFQISTAGLGPYMKRHWGAAAKLPLLGVSIYQRIKFGSLANASAVEGLRHTAAPVLILQSNDDGIIHYRDNYEVLYAAFQRDPKKTFLPLTGHNHNITTPPEVDRKKRALLKTLRSGTATPDELAQMDTLKAQADNALLAQFIAFFDKCLT